MQDCQEILDLEADQIFWEAVWNGRSADSPFRKNAESDF
jgi:hypothetical protein